MGLRGAFSNNRGYLSIRTLFTFADSYERGNKNFGSLKAWDFLITSQILMKDSCSSEWNSLSIEIPHRSNFRLIRFLIQNSSTFILLKLLNNIIIIMQSDTKFRQNLLDTLGRRICWRITIPHYVFTSSE